MKQKKQNRSAVLPLVRVTPTEKKEIQEAYLASPFPNQSAFIRAKLLDTAHELDTVEAFGEVILMGKITDLLNAIGGKIVKIVKLRKEESTIKMDKKETELFTDILKNIQKAQSELLKKEEV